MVYNLFSQTLVFLKIWEADASWGNNKRNSSHYLNPECQLLFCTYWSFWSDVLQEWHEEPRKGDRQFPIVLASVPVVDCLGNCWECLDHHCTAKQVLLYNMFHSCQFKLTVRLIIIALSTCFFLVFFTPYTAWYCWSRMRVCHWNLRVESPRVSSSQCSPILCKVSQQVFITFCYEKARQMLAKVYILY